MQWKTGGLNANNNHFNIAYVIRIEMDQNLRRYQRTYYNGIDLLSDIGGVQSILTSFAAIVLMMVKHDNVSNFIAAELFKIS